MSKSPSLRDRIFGTKPEPEPPQEKAELYIELLGENTSETASTVQERTVKAPRIAEYQALYQLDSVTFGLVNFLVYKIVPGIVFVGDAESCKKLEEWKKTIGLRSKLEDVVRDIILAGGSWFEPVWKSIDIVDIRIINPDTMDYIRKEDSNVKLDDNLEPVGYTQNVGGIIRYWYKDKITSESGKEVYASKKGEDIRRRICYVKLLGWGDSYLGISMMGPGYRSAMIRCNIEDMIGEAAFRGGGMIAYVDGQPSEEVKRNLIKDIKNLTAKKLLLLSNKFSLQSAPIPDTSQRQDQIYQLADTQASSLGIPLDAILSGGHTYKQDLSGKLTDLEVRTSGYQERLALQLNKLLIKPLLDKWKMKDAELKFVSASPSGQLTRSRVVSSMARRNLMQYDPEVELQLRKELGLPHGVLEEVVKKRKENPAAYVDKYEAQAEGKQFTQ